MTQQFDLALGGTALPITADLRKAVVSAYGGKCQYCRATGANHIDHIIAKNDSGFDDLTNYTLACGNCNSRKSDLRLPKIYRSILIARAVRKAPKILALLSGMGRKRTIPNSVRSTTIPCVSPRRKTTLAPDAGLWSSTAIDYWPMFSLEKQPKRLFLYDDGRISILVRGREKGIPQIWDKDVLCYVLSLIRQSSESHVQTITLSPNDFFRLFNLNTSRTAYARIENSLDRLLHSTITTNALSNGHGPIVTFSWLDAVSIKSDERWRTITIAPSTELLSLARSSDIKPCRMTDFDLPPLQRRISEIAWSSHRSSFDMKLEDLRNISGSASPLKLFKRNVVAAADQIPGFSLSLTSSHTAGRIPISSWIVRFCPKV